MSKWKLLIWTVKNYYPKYLKYFLISDLGKALSDVSEALMSSIFYTVYLAMFRHNHFCVIGIVSCLLQQVDVAHTGDNLSIVELRWFYGRT